MKYAKWKLDFTNDPHYGIGPDSIVADRGDTIEGAFFVGEPKDWIYGYLNDDFDFTGLEAWQVTEVTREDMLNQALLLNSECYVDEHGRIIAPMSDD
jgi:hypothetical protein